MTNNVESFMNDQELGSLDKGFRATEQSPVMATPAVVLAAVLGKKVVGAAAAGVAGVGVAYTVGRTVN